MRTPILFLVFNRPKLTRIVFQRIREAQPARLYIAADGPRANKEGEALICEQVRAIVDDVDWKCEVITLFRKANLGCGPAVSSAISWFFEQEEEGIILEDDCLPNLSFFSYCESLLEKYRCEENIMQIGGTNFLERTNIPGQNYYFSMITYPWGWASWRRAWKYYQFRLDPSFLIERSLEKYNLEEKQITYWKFVYEAMSGDNPRWNTWDYQWMMAIFRNNGLNINPSVNLVQNIGFGEGGTHTVSVDDWKAKLKTYSIKNLEHPKFIERAERIDDITFYKLFPWEKEQSFFQKNITRVKDSISYRFKKIFS